MKTKLVFVVLALVAVIIGASSCAAGASSRESPSQALPNANIILSQQNTGIWVNGEGKVTVVPDVAILNLGVEAQALTVAETQTQATTAMDAVMKELDNHGVAKKDIKTQQYSIYPVIRWDKDKEILVGYRVSNMVTVKIRKVEDTGIIIDAVAKAGGDNIRINGISFTVDNPSAYNEQARKLAIADAQARAKQLADLAGVRLGKPTYISESGGFVPIFREYMAKAGDMAPAPAPTPISPGETEVRLTVQVVYGID